MIVYGSWYPDREHRDWTGSCYRPPASAASILSRRIQADATASAFARRTDYAEHEVRWAIQALARASVEEDVKWATDRIARARKSLDVLRQLMA